MSLSAVSFHRVTALVLVAVSLGACVPAAAQERSLDGVNFTGPLVTANPAGVPRGHWYIEPYLVRIDSDAGYDGAGHRRSTADSGAWLTVVPIAYGMGERVTAQVNLSAVRAEAAGAQRCRAGG